MPPDAPSVERADLLRQMIAEYRKKTEIYAAMIQEWERELGVPSATTHLWLDQSRCVSGPEAR